MKRLRILILLSFVILLFSACAEPIEPVNSHINPNFETDMIPELAHNQILDRYTGAIFTLGDHRSVFEEAFGEGHYMDLVASNIRLNEFFAEELGEDATQLSPPPPGRTAWRYAPCQPLFLGGSTYRLALAVFFDYDYATSFLISSNRIAFRDVSFDMTVEDLESIRFWERSPCEVITSFTRRYRADGRNHLPRHGAVSAHDHLSVSFNRDGWLYSISMSPRVTPQPARGR